MNTWFEKKRVQYGTWMHPRMRVSHVIDFSSNESWTVHVLQRCPVNERSKLLDRPQPSQSKAKD